MKIADIDRLNSSYLLNDLSNLNEISRKDVAFDNIKSHKKPGFHPLCRRYIFRKSTEGRGEGGGGRGGSTQPFLGLRNYNVFNPYQPSAAFHIEIFFYMKCNTELKLVNLFHGIPSHDSEHQAQKINLFLTINQFTKKEL